MSEIILPTALETALVSLENAVDAQENAGSGDVESLRQRLEIAEEQVSKLKTALAGAASLRADALAKVDTAVEQVEMLLATAEPTAKSMAE